MTEHLYQRRSDVLFTVVDEEVLALDVAGGHCFGMNMVASEVWQLLEEPRSLPQLCAVLTERFDVSDAQCREEVGALLERFRSDGLIQLQPSS